VTQSRTAKPRLSIVPDPDTVTTEPDYADAYDAATRVVLEAYEQGRLAALAETADARSDALANLERIEAMSLEELDVIIQLATATANIKRNARPALRLAANAGELVTA
jgi:hypothetical protein